MEESGIHQSDLNVQDEGSKQSQIPLSIRKKRKLIELQQHHDSLSSESSDDAEDIDIQITTHLKDTSQRGTAAKFKHKIIQNANARKNSSAVDASSTMRDQYKLARAQLEYILRENEMLCDEWSNTEKKLKRLKTERRVLLDVLVKKGYYTQDD